MTYDANTGRFSDLFGGNDVKVVNQNGKEFFNHTIVVPEKAATVYGGTTVYDDATPLYDDTKVYHFDWSGTVTMGRLMANTFEYGLRSFCFSRGIELKLRRSGLILVDFYWEMVKERCTSTFLAEFKRDWNRFKSQF